MNTDYEKRMLRVIDYIFENADGDLSLDRLADVAAMSRFHWHRVFHAVTGETCAQAVRRIRLQRAACWLVQKDWPVAKVAKKAGYPNVQSFSRVFQTGFGMTPGAFRKQGKADLPLMQSTKGKRKVFTVEIRNTEDRRIVGMAHTGAYMEIGKAFEKVSAIATSRGLWPDVKSMMGLYYDDPNAVAEADLRSFAALEVSPDMALPDGLEEMSVTKGDVAVLVFKGSYSGLKTAYNYLYGEWLPNSGREMRDEPSYEVYLNSPIDTAPEELLTQICVPLKG